MAKAPKVNPVTGGRRRGRLAATRGGQYPGPARSLPPAGSPAALASAAAAKAKALAKQTAHFHPRAIKHPKAKKAAKGWSAGDVSCCVVQAVAASAPFPVTDEEILALHLLIAGPDEYVLIGDGLEAAAEYGLAGHRPVFEEVTDAAIHDSPGGALRGRRISGLILGVDIPAPHAVLDDGAAWHSWGQRWEPWAEPDEMWSVCWPETGLR
jgi:hypothetical protein